MDTMARGWMRAKIGIWLVLVVVVWMLGAPAVWPMQTTLGVPLPAATVIHSAAEWGLGVDYLYEGYLLLLQVNQTDVLHNNVDLLIKDVETRLLANLRKSFLADRLQTQLIGMHAIESDYTLIRPTLLYRLTDNLNAQVGYLFIAGRARSLIGQYRRNDEGFVRLEYKL